MTDSIIEQIKDPDQISLANDHIAQITGQRRIPKPIFYRDKRTGAEYCHLAGGIGWPRDPKERPGFAVVVAVDKPDTDEKPVMRVLEEATAPTVEGLLKECVRLQRKYGHRECQDLFRIWYGDQERQDTFTTLFNFSVKPTENHDPDRVHVVGGYDHEKPNAFERYVNQIRSCLAGDPETGKKRLYLGDCIKLQNHIQNTPTDAAVKGSARDYPALAALGSVVHTILMETPWLKFVEPERTFPTVEDSLTEMQEEYELDLWGDEEEGYDDGKLVRTCRL